jgi:hypothetical protein
MPLKNRVNLMPDDVASSRSKEGEQQRAYGFLHKRLFSIPSRQTRPYLVYEQIFFYNFSERYHGEDESINQVGPRVPKGIHLPNYLPPRQATPTQYPACPTKHQDCPPDPRHASNYPVLTAPHVTQKRI